MIKKARSNEETQNQPPEKFSKKKGAFRNFEKFIGKHSGTGLLPATLLKKRLWHRCFPVNFAKFLRTHFLQKTFRLLKFISQFVKMYITIVGINNLCSCTVSKQCLHIFFCFSRTISLHLKSQDQESGCLRKLLYLQVCTLL